MKNLIVTVLFVGVFSNLSYADSNMIQWSGNGHWYQVVNNQEPLSWVEAQSQAELLGGYLATLTSVKEDQWVFDSIVNNEDFWNSRSGPHIGAFQNLESADYYEPNGGWEWVTGEPWGYSNWQVGQPDNDNGDEHFAHFKSIGQGPPLDQWNDLAITTLIPPIAFIVEYDNRIWTVDDDGSADFDNIQAAVDASSDGDEIIVMPGTYTSTQDGHVVNMLGKAVTLQSSDPSDTDVVAATIIDGENARRGIACFNNETSKTHIAGFTIANGYSVEFEYDIDSDVNRNGGGMFNINSSPTVTDCVFSSNTAVGNFILIGGGGVGNISCSPTFNRCVFVNNTTTGHGAFGGGGGGMGNVLSSPVLTDCVFQNNTASGGKDEFGAGFGGGLGNINNCFPKLTNCIFTGNTADIGGGMINYNNSNTTLTDCTFTDNTASVGGGMHNDNSSPTLENCTFENNTATNDGGGMYNYVNSNPTLTDTTVCGNTPDQIFGGWTDNGGNTIANACVCPDINDDGYVNVTDLLAIIDQWGLSDSPADVNEDGIVDVTDLLIVVGNWGPCE